MHRQSTGYPFNWFDKNFALDLLTCNLCFDVLNDPHQCRKGHCFCKWCIEKLITVKEECPVCKESLTLANMSSCLILRNIINRSVVKCCSNESVSSSISCTWTGELEKLQHHILDDCQYRMVVCPLHKYECCSSECDGNVYRKLLVEHIDSQMKIEDNLVKFISVLTQQPDWLETYRVRQAASDMLNPLFRQNVSSTITDSDSGDVYTGMIHADSGTADNNDPVKHGFGCMKYSDGRVYIGTWSYNIPTGYAYILYPNQDMFIGQINNGVYHGMGVYVTIQGKLYTGMYDNGLKHGKGQYVYLDIESFEGEYSNDHRLEGKQCFTNLDTFSGKWVDDSPSYGEYQYSNGDNYVGTFLKQCRDGYGEMKYANGDKYVGEWQNGTRHGNGVMTTVEDGYEYDGDWIDNKRHGVGTRKVVAEDSLESYVGDWYADQRHGHGVHTSHEGDIYDGDWNSDLMSGHGTYKWKSGDMYKGEFFESEMHGQGDFTFATGNEYSGTISHGQIDIRGTMRYENGDVYDGEWNVSNKHGQAIMMYATGDTYEGQWENDLQGGFGTMTYSDGSRYVGMWKDGMKNGHGEQTWAASDVYKGEWINDVMCGHGIMVYSDGRSYEGDWLNDVKHGDGTMFTADRTKSYKGQWEYNKVVIKEKEEGDNKQKEDTELKEQKEQKEHTGGLSEEAMYGWDPKWDTVNAAVPQWVLDAQELELSEGKRIDEEIKDPVLAAAMVIRSSSPLKREVADEKPHNTDCDAESDSEHSVFEKSIPVSTTPPPIRDPHTAVSLCLPYGADEAISLDEFDSDGDGDEEVGVDSVSVSLHSSIEEEVRVEREAFLMKAQQKDILLQSGPSDDDALYKSDRSFDETAERVEESMIKEVITVGQSDKSIAAIERNEAV